MFFIKAVVNLRARGGRVNLRHWNSALDFAVPALYTRFKIKFTAMRFTCFARKIILRLLLVGFAAVPLALLAASKPTVVLVSGEYEYSSMLTLPALKTRLETDYGFNCVYLERKGGENIPGLEALDRADLVILIIRRMTLPEEQLGRFKKYLAAGKPLIGLRTASHAFENWKAWDNEVLGGNYKGHHGNTIVAMARVNAAAVSHPILKGVAAEFATGGSLYKTTPLAPGATLLISGSIPSQPAEPMAWTHTYQGARVCYSSLGDPKDFFSQPFMQLLVNTVFWALDKPAPAAPVKAFASLPPKKVSLEQFENLAGHKKFTVLDVRTPHEYSVGHVVRATLLPWGSDDFEKKAAALNKDEPLALHCARGSRSAKAAEKLHALGFKFIYDFSGGMAEWEAAGRKVVEEK
ncbi:MAG: ThuA domain-containing protein [Verrucomicrobia bacterium]|nr:ThuA domain-containing protein [Verrucomicrobiota bacterium]